MSKQKLEEFLANLTKQRKAELASLREQNLWLRSLGELYISHKTEGSKDLSKEAVFKPTKKRKVRTTVFNGYLPQLGTQMHTIFNIVLEKTRISRGRLYEEGEKRGVFPPNIPSLLAQLRKRDLVEFEGHEVIISASVAKLADASDLKFERP